MTNVFHLGGRIRWRKRFLSFVFGEQQGRESALYVANRTAVDFLSSGLFFCTTKNCMIFSVKADRSLGDARILGGKIISSFRKLVHGCAERRI